MQIFHPSSGLIHFAGIPLATLWLMAVAIPSQPAAAYPRNNFQLCASQLLRAGISPAAATDACSAALYPRDLTICVTRIDLETNIAAADALATCKQVRRPRDLATCVVNIRNGTQNAPVPDILDNCRRSLLPVRFADCVVGINRELDLPATQVMASCIDGSDRPQDFYPPGISSPRSLPLPNSPIRVPSVPIPVGPT